MLRVGIVGLGYWGPNLLRCLGSQDECRVTALCDRDGKRLAQAAHLFPQARTTNDETQLFDRDLVDALVIATPTKTHYPLARRALEAGIHTFVEKPLATSVQQCEDLIQLADAQDLTLFVGHVFLYSAAVQKLRDLVTSGDLGELSYVSSSRLNLGPVRCDVNALWDLAPHDISIMLDLMPAAAQSVSCSGLAHLNDQVHDVCNLSIQFENKRMGIVHVSWLDPYKRREMTVIGDKKMAVYNDIEPLEKIKVYDIGIETLSYSNSFGEFPYTYRYGDTFSPRLNEVEPLKAECRSFVRSVIEGVPSKTDGVNGLNVVQVLEAADRSLHNGGGHVAVTQPKRLAPALPESDSQQICLSSSTARLR